MDNEKELAKEIRRLEEEAEILRQELDELLREVGLAPKQDQALLQFAMPAINQNTQEMIMDEMLEMMQIPGWPIRLNELWDMVIQESFNH